MSLRSILALGTAASLLWAAASCSAPEPPAPAAEPTQPAAPASHAPPPPGPSPGPGGHTTALVKQASLVHAAHIQGMAAVGRYLETEDKDLLEGAVEQFHRAIPPENLPGADLRGRPPESLLDCQKSLMFMAWSREQLGDDSLRLWLHEQDIIDRDAYDFFFGTQPMAEVVAWVNVLDCQENLKAVQEALERYGHEHQRQFPESLDALVPHYLPELPTCPASGSCSYCDGYRRTADGRGFDLVCDDHPLLGDGALAIASGQQGGAAMDPDLEQRFKVFTMLTGGYTDSHRVERHLPHLAQAAQLGPGDVVADIGSGPGLFTHRFADAVGAEGRVIAVDINASVLHFVDFVAARRSGEVETVLAEKTDCEIPAETLDSALVIQTYHAMLDLQRPSDPQQYERMVRPWLESIHRAMRPGGRLVIQDTDLPVDVLKRQLEGAGFAFVDHKTLLDRNFILVFERPSG